VIQWKRHRKTRKRIDADRVTVRRASNGRGRWEAALRLTDHAWVVAYGATARRAKVALYRELGAR